MSCRHSTWNTMWIYNNIWNNTILKKAYLLDLKSFLLPLLIHVLNQIYLQIQVCVPFLFVFYKIYFYLNVVLKIYHHNSKIIMMNCYLLSIIFPSFLLVLPIIISLSVIYVLFLIIPLLGSKFFYNYYLFFYLNFLEFQIFLHFLYILYKFYNNLI